MRLQSLRTFNLWRNRLWLTLCLVVVALNGTVGAEAEVDGIILGYNIAQGMLSQLVLRTKEEIVQEVGGQKIKRIEEIELEYAFEKKENEDDAFVSRLVSLQYREATLLYITPKVPFKLVRFGSNRFLSLDETMVCIAIRAPILLTRLWMRPLRLSILRMSVMFQWRPR